MNRGKIYIVVSLVLICISALQSIIKAESIAHKYQSQGIMSEQDFKKLNIIGLELQHTGAINDQDLNWMIHAMHSPPLIQGPHNEYRQNEHTFLIAMQFDLLRRVTHAQEIKIFPEMIKLLDSNDVRLRGLGVLNLTYLDDSRAIPYIKKMLKDPYPGVRADAEQTATLLKKRGIM